MNLVRSNTARNDLKQLRTYIAQDSPIYAWQFIQRILARAEALHGFPNLGRRVPETDRDDIRECVSGLSDHLPNRLRPYFGADGAARQPGFKQPGQSALGGLADKGNRPKTYKMADLKFQPVRHDHKALLEKASKRRGFKEAYEALELEYALAHEMLAARTRAGLTQEAVATRMGTTKSAVSRLESAGKHAPSVASLKRYAEAVGCTLKIELVPSDRKHRKNVKPDLQQDAA